MKKLLLLFTLCALSFSSCDKFFGDESETTSFKISKNTTFNVISIGADIAVNYQLTKPIEGVSIIATPSAEWITESKSLESAMVFTIEENTTDASRSATITFVYDTFESVVTVTQSAAGTEDEEFTEFAHLSGHYWGQRYGATTCDHYYSLILGDSGNCRDMATGDLNLINGNNYLFIDLFSTTVPERLNIEFNVPVGNYALDHSNSAVAGTIAELPTYLYHEDGKNGKETEFVNGYVTVTEKSIYAYFIDKRGNEYKYRCATRFVDNSSNFGLFYAPQNLSTLNGDLDVEFSQYEAYASHYGDRYFVGKSYWSIFVIDNTSGDSFDIVLLCDSDNKIPTGTFPISTDLNKECLALRGYANCEGVPVWSWYTRYTDDRTVLGSAPLVDGEIAITENGNNTHTIAINVVDDLGNKISGTCVGQVEAYGI